MTDRSPVTPSRVVEGDRAGWRALTLDNDALRVTVLPEKGGEIVELVDVESGVDVLFHAPWGLAPPGSAPREGSGELEFLGGYAGGWQELFPSAGDPCVYRGEPIPFHGEVATLPWEAQIVEERAGSVLELTVRCRRTPFRLRRRMRLRPGEAILDVEQTATNDSAETAHFVWGHHCVVGPPFLEGGCLLRVPAGTIETIPEVWEETARLQPGQRAAWPDARLRDGGTVDLSVVPGPEAGSHDDVYVTDLAAGWVEVENPRLGLVFRLDFDEALYRWLVSWQAYGGAHDLPLAGSYALGIEPWTTRLDLERAVEAGEAIALGRGESLTTEVSASISHDTRGRP